MSFTTQGRIDAIDSRSVQPNPMNAQLTEIMRLITNLIRTGVVTEVDRENWLCRVKTGELETNWISWLTLRAGNARTWWRPSEGEQVVLLSLGGNLETAFALPAVYSNQFAPPSTSADACVTEHPDGGWFEYEPTTGRWYVRGIKSMVIEAADNITMKTSEFVLEADRTRINSEVVINGGVNAMSKGADIIDVMQRLGGVADRLDYRKAAALGSTFLTLGAAPEVAASAANAMVRELSIATMQSKSFFEGMNLLKLNPEVIEKQMTKDAMGTIQRVLEKVNALPQDKRLSAMTMLFGKEFGDDAAKLANNLPELQRQLKLTAGNDALGSMQKESDINKDSLSAQWLLVKTGTQNTFSSLGETLRQPLMDILYTVKSVTGALRRWVEANPELTGTLMKVAAIVAAVR